MAPDRRAARAYFEASAGQGNASAALNLAKLYAKAGKGVPFDPVMVKKWLRLAAEYGSQEAIRDLQSTGSGNIGTAKSGVLVRPNKNSDVSL
jgi:TPR repeat protein